MKGQPKFEKVDMETEIEIHARLKEIIESYAAKGIYIEMVPMTPQVGISIRKDVNFKPKK